MTWADPSTRATGDVVTSAIWNVQVTNSRNITYNQIQYGRGYASGNVAVGAGANCVFDTHTTVYAGYSDGVNNDRLYAVKAGLHLFAGLIFLSAASVITLKVDGSARATLGSFTNYDNTLLIHMTEGQYITLALTTARTMYLGSQIDLKLMSGGWTNYDYWGTI